RGYRPVTADIRVRKGVIVTGRIIDKATGNPVEGSVIARVPIDNRFVKEYSDGSGQSVLIWSNGFQHTDAHGVFRDVTIPGPILLMGRGHPAGEEFKTAVMDPDYPQFFERHGDFYIFRGYGPGIAPCNFCKVLQFQPGVATVKQDIVLERERRGVLGV